MAITINSAPTVPPVPTPVNDCLEWCLLPADADVFDTPGTYATVDIEFPATFSGIPANGTEITVWGKTFTIDDTSDHTSTSFKVVSSGNTSGTNFRNMLKSNFFFLRAVDIEIGGSGFRFTELTWQACGEQDYFSGASMDFSALESEGAVVTVTNGTTPVLVTGATLQTRLLRERDFTGIYDPVTKWEGHKLRGNCDTALEICVDYMQDAKRTLYTPLPDLTLDSEIDPEGSVTMLGQFKIQYGITYQSGDCVPESGDFEESDAVYVMDTVFEAEEITRMARYIFDHPDGPVSPSNHPQFLTNKPDRLLLGVNSFAWLWLAAGYASVAPDNIRLRWNVIYKNGTSDFDFVDYLPLAPYQVHCFNVSPLKLKTIFSLTDLDDVSHYFVRAEAWSSGGSLLQTVGWETYFAIEEICENVIDVYFKTPPGGIGTLLCEVQEKEIIQEGTEICLDTPCSLTRVEKAAYGGRGVNQIRNYEKITLKARRNFTPEDVAYFRGLKASSERWIQVENTYLQFSYDADLLYTAKRLLVDPGGVKIYQTGEYIDLVITGSIGDVDVQNPKGV